MKEGTLLSVPVAFSYSQTLIKTVEENSKSFVFQGSPPNPVAGLLAW